MKLILRNFWNTIKTYRQSASFNILGLTLAFAACYLIYIQVSFEFGFGKVHKDYESIYRVDITVEGKGAAIGNPGVKVILDQQSGVKASALIFGFMNDAEIESGGERISVEPKISKIDTCLNNVFEFEMIEGNFDDILVSNSVIIPLSLAETMFEGPLKSIGHQVFISGHKEPTYEVVGVYEDFSDRAVLKNDIYISTDFDYYGRFEGFSHTLYFSIFPNTDITELNKVVEALVIKNISGFFGDMSFALNFTPLDQVYFKKIDFVPHSIGNKGVSISLIFVALLILGIVIINFINFATAIAPSRLKAINTYRVLGHSLAGLRAMLVFEAIFTAIISFILSLVVLEAISSTNFANLISTEISPLQNLGTIGILGLISLAIGIIAGVYPAFHITSFSPAMVLNGGKSLPRSAIMIRQILLSVQYIISISMVIISLFINIQNQYMFNKDYGYDSENILEIKVSSNHKLIESELRQKCSYIDNIAFSNSSIMGGHYNGNVLKTKEGKEGMYDFLYVNNNYVDIMGLELIEGEDFLESDIEKEDTYALFNETAKKMYDLEVGQTTGSSLNSFTIKGFFKDVHHRSLHSAISPLGLILVPAWSQGNMIIKYYSEENLDRLIEDVKTIVAEINNGEIPEFKTPNDQRYSRYKKDQDLNTLITWAAILAILISVIGVVGLVSLETKERTREIAIRKVNGATTRDVLTMFNMKFIKIIGICYLMALPLSWYVVNSWLSGFEYRVDMSAWVFIVAGIFITLITIIIVTLKSYRIASTNPAEAMIH